MFKNTAGQKFRVFAFNSTTNQPVSGDAANITAYISKDYGAVTVLGDTSATEEQATNAKGYYLFDATQAETNADSINLTAKSTTANVVVIGDPAHIFTLPSLSDIAGSVWDAAAFSHTQLGSFGQALMPLDYGTVTSATTSTVTISGSSDNEFYTGQRIRITGGTGSGQSRVITAYDGATLTATVRDWVQVPDGTSSYILEAATVEARLSAGVIHGGSSTRFILSHLTDPPFYIQCSDSPCIYLDGDDSLGCLFAANSAGPGVYFTTGTGVGLKIESTSGIGMQVNGGTDAAKFIGGGASGNGIVFTRGGASGDDIKLTNSDAPTLAAALLDLANGIETGITLKQALRLAAAALAGKRSNSGTATEQFDAIGSPGTARIVGNLNASGDGTPTLTP